MHVCIRVLYMFLIVNSHIPALYASFTSLWFITTIQQLFSWKMSWFQLFVFDIDNNTPSTSAASEHFDSCHNTRELARWEQFSRFRFWRNGIIFPQWFNWWCIRWEYINVLNSFMMNMALLYDSTHKSYFLSAWCIIVVLFIIIHPPSLPPHQQPFLFSSPSSL